MAQKGYTLEHTTMMNNQTDTNITNINIECKSFNLTRTYFTHNITTDMVDDMIKEEDLIDKCENLIFIQKMTDKVVVYLMMFFTLFFLLYSFFCLFMEWSSRVKERNIKIRNANIKVRNANRLQPPSYAELSPEYPFPPSFEDLQIDPELPESEEPLRYEHRKRNRKRQWKLLFWFVVLILLLFMFYSVTSTNNFHMNSLKDVQKNTPCIEFCWNFAVISSLFELP